MRANELGALVPPAAARLLLGLAPPRRLLQMVAAERSAGRADAAEDLRFAMAQLVAAATSDCGSAEITPGRSAAAFDVMTTAEAAAQLGVSTRQVLNLIGDGSLDGERSGGRWLVDRASVASLLERRSA